MDNDNSEYTFNRDSSSAGPAAQGNASGGAQDIHERHYRPQQYGQPFSQSADTYSGFYSFGAGSKEYIYADKPSPEKKNGGKTKKARGRIWIPIVIAAALLVGAGAGAGSYFLFSAKNAGTDKTPAASVQTAATDAAPALESAAAQGTESMRQVPDETAESVQTAAENETDAAESETAAAVSAKRPDTPVTFDFTANTAKMTPSEIYSTYSGACVGIASESTSKNIWGQTVPLASSGSGFIISEDGYVLTNYHVVEGANNVTVMLYDGTEYPASVVGYENSTCDVALLKIDASGLPTVSIGDSSKVVVGESVCAIGNPLGELTFTLTVGYVSALNREVNTDGRPISMFQTDASINSGNSGGPLFDSCGNVIGITTAKYSGSTSSGTTIEGIGFAIPINDVTKIVEDLVNYGYVTGRAYLGISAADSSYYGKNLPAGAYVADVYDGNCAKAAGIQKGDVIVHLGDTVIGSRTDLTGALSQIHSGETVSVTVYRDGQYLTFDITLDERPQVIEEPQPEETEDPDPFGFGDWGSWGFGG